MCPELVGIEEDRSQSGQQSTWGQQLGTVSALHEPSAPCASTDLQRYKEALFQKVGAGGLLGAGGQAAAALNRAYGSAWHPGEHSISFLPPVSASNHCLFLYPCRLFLPQNRKKKKVSSRSPLKLSHQLPRQTS